MSEFERARRLCVHIPACVCVRRSQFRDVWVCCCDCAARPCATAWRRSALDVRNNALEGLLPPTLPALSALA